MELPSSGPDSERFRQVLGHFATGVTVITGAHEGEPVGFACQAFAALSLDPPLVLFCPGKLSGTWPRIARTGELGVNVLAASQRDLARKFGVTAADKFDGHLLVTSRERRADPARRPGLGRLHGGGRARGGRPLHRDRPGQRAR